MRLLLAFAAGLAVPANGQELGPDTRVPPRDFIQRSAPPYQSLAFEDYELPDLALIPPFDRRNYYGPLGNHLIHGYDVFSWRETRATYDTGELAPSEIRKNNRYNLFDRNLVGFDSYGGWDARLIISDEIRTVFTPLTLNATGLNGIRLDVATRTTQWSLLASRFRDPIYRGGFKRPTPRNSTLLLGGHGEVRMGALTLGATGLSFQLFDSKQSDFSLRGDLASDQTLPSFLIVRFADDSPGDDVAGATVSQVQLVINGQPRPDLRPTFVQLDSRDPTAVGVTSRLTGQFQRRPYPDAGTRYADIFYLQQHLAGEDVSGSANIEELLRFVQIVPAREEFRADGTQVVLALFDLRQEPYVGSVDVEAVVGNDYDMRVVGVFESEPGSTRQEALWQVGGIEADRQAPGNVQDLSNLDRVRLRVGNFTGRAVVGVNGRFEAYGARLRWEVARSVDFFRYPDGRPAHRAPKEEQGVRLWQGERSSRQDLSYYATAEWSGGRLALGGELYSMGPRFSRKLIGTPVEAVLGQEVLDGFVEDNDDNDRWPDSGPGPRGTHLGAADYDPDGVFPGNDSDNDGVPDTNRNGNDLPDYEEAFLLFDVESDAYTYGRDWNHNGIADEREDDLRPDYPYELDQAGYNAFGRLDLGAGFRLLAGRLRAGAISSSARNDALYGGLAYERQTPSGSYVFGELFVQSVHDDVENDYVTFAETLTEPSAEGSYHAPGSRVFERTIVTDRLEWRSSLDRQHYLEAGWRPLPGLLVDGNVRWQINEQRSERLSDGTIQRADEIRLLTSVGRIEYRWNPSASWEVTAQAKVLSLRRVRQTLDLALQDERTFVPILKARYTITPRTQLWLGMQGVPRLAFRLRDHADRRRSRDEQVRVVQLTNQSNYFGYQLSTSVGLRTSERIYRDDTRRAEDFDITSVFMRVFLGFN